MRSSDPDKNKHRPGPDDNHLVMEVPPVSTNVSKAVHERFPTRTDGDAMMTEIYDR